MWLSEKQGANQLLLGSGAVKVTGRYRGLAGLDGLAGLADVPLVRLNGLASARAIMNRWWQY